MIEDKILKGEVSNDVYSYDEVKSDTIDYFSGSELPTSTWIGKYAMRRGDGFLETNPDEMHKRMAKEFAKKEQFFKDKSNLNGSFNSLSEYGQKREFLSEEKIYELFKDFKHIIPQGSVMSMLGNSEVIGSLSNCIVLPKVYDSYGGIMFSDQQLTALYKRRCGVGIDISTLRPSGTKVLNAAGTTSGAVSFMERFSHTTREVAQNGRRGALMITIDVRHPESKEFALIKQDETKVTGANVSIKLTDDFMQAVENDEDYVLRFPIEADIKFDSGVREDSLEYDVLTQGAIGQYKKIRAKELWDTIVECARNTAEPGLMFWDKHHTYSTSSVYPDYVNITTNPCAEISMGNDSCRLIANNMFNCIKNPFTKDASFDFDMWYEINYESQRLMDDLVELELESIDRILEKVDEDPEPDHIKEVEVKTWKTLYESGKRGRRTGLGFTALGDTLAALGFKYDSDEALEMTDKIVKVKTEGEWDSSIDMAIERGHFADWDSEIDETSEFIQMMKKDMPEQYERNKKFGRRNISISTVAPTGSLSMLASLFSDTMKMHYVTSGVEPMFNTEENTCWFIRRKKINESDGDVSVDFIDDLGDKWQEFKVFHPGFQMWATINHPDINIQEMDNENLKKLVSQSPYGGSGSSEIDWIKRVEMQSIIQKYITHSISSTINLPTDVSVDKVKEIYSEAWKRGLKGITVYRDGARSGVLISENQKDGNPIVKVNAPPRPDTLPCDIYHVTAKGEKWIVLVGILDNEEFPDFGPYEVFAFKEKNVHLTPKWREGFLSKVRKGRYDLECDGFVLEDLKEHFESDEQEALTRMISTALRHGTDISFIVEQLEKSEGTIVSFSKAVSRTIKKYISDDAPISDKTCSNCNEEALIRQEGCLVCTNPECGYSKCS